ncbi:MAG: hypothetical protein ACTTJC_02025 [Campylobacter sp.]
MPKVSQGYTKRVPGLGMSQRVKEKTHLSLKMFCELNGLKYRDILSGFFSRKAREIFKNIGIDIPKKF